MDIKAHLFDQDKSIHRWVGAIIGSAAALAALITLRGTVHPGVAAVIAAAVVGAAKEAVDRFANARAAEEGLPPPHGVELGDFLATLEGGVLVALPLLLR